MCQGCGSRTETTVSTPELRIQKTEKTGIRVMSEMASRRNRKTSLWKRKGAHHEPPQHRERPCSGLYRRSLFHPWKPLRNFPVPAADIFILDCRGFKATGRRSSFCEGLHRFCLKKRRILLVQGFKRNQCLHRAGEFSEKFPARYGKCLTGLWDYRGFPGKTWFMKPGCGEVSLRR